MSVVNRWDSLPIWKQGPGMMVWTLGRTWQQALLLARGGYSEKAMAPHSSTLAWKIPWREEPGGLQSMGSLPKSDTTEQLHFNFSLSALEEETATHSSVLAWRTQGTGQPSGLPSMGSHRVRHDWSDLAAAAAAKVVTGCKGNWQKVGSSVTRGTSRGARSSPPLWQALQVEMFKSKC